jgi:hypothetical protein
MVCSNQLFTTPALLHGKPEWAFLLSPALLVNLCHDPLRPLNGSNNHASMQSLSISVDMYSGWEQTFLRKK